MMFRKLFIVLSLAVVVFPDRGLRGVDVQPERHVTFKEECPRTYLLDPLRPGQDEASTILDRWIKAWPLGGSDSVDLSHRVILRLKDSRNLDPIVEETGLRLRRQVGQDVFILEARHALEAINLCETLSLREGVLLCHPERRRNHRKQGGYAPEPKDPYYREQGEINFGQWHLESRDPTTGVRNGTDINARVAWARSRGEGVVIGIVDDGVESGHPDLAGNGVNAWHYDFFQGVPGGENGTSSHYHGTQVAGLAAAVGDNGVGVSGVAPASGWVSMRIFSDSDRIAGEIGLADAFEYRIQEIPIQNHSWGNAANQFGGPGMLERMAIDNALQSGRGGLGVVMVRSGGNRAEFGGNVNDDGYANDPGVIAVGAVGDSGRVASYSSPGACVLVSGPSGDTGFKKLVTTDLSGTDGINNINFPSDLADYAYNSLGFSGTSGSSPIVAGVVALMLSVNPDLSVRDVQQILILSSGQTDTMNPNIRANGSGFPFSHLTGFGVPDAGLAVQLAEGWVARPAPMEVEYSSDVVQSVKDGGLTVRLQGDDVPVDLISIPASSGDGIVPDEPTAQVSLVDVGMASAEIMQDLTGKGALIQRGENKFFEKIDFAAAAGAELAIIYNNTGGDQRLRMGGTEYTTIPAVFIGQNDGEALRDQIATNLAVTAGMTTDQTFYDFEVTESLICEHVGVTVDSTHTSRGDLRIILVSPSGTKSVLQVPNLDTSAGPQDWTYWSVQHFFEPTKGTWQVGFSDQLAEGTGDVLSVKLTLRGVAISDVDKDGLDDFWEQSVFGNLLQSAPGDPDGDGFGNLFEQVASMNPVLNETPFQMGAHRVFDDIVRLSWPSVEGQTYSVESMDDLGEAFQQVEQVTGRKHETEMILPASALRRFLRVGELP